MIDFDKLLFRASANGDVMTLGSGEITEKQLATIKEYKAKEKRTEIQDKELERLIYKRDNPALSTTCINRLIKLYAYQLGREEELKNKYVTKGSMAEDTAITLYSLIKKTAFFKNTEQLENKYVCGMPDLGDSSVITDSEEIIDIKCSWSLFTFLKAKFDSTNDMYYWQGLTYLALVPKAKRFRLAYCLVNTPAEVLLKEKQNLIYKMPGIDYSVSPEYKEACQQLERNHIFDIELFRKENPEFAFDNELWAWDIPRDQRMFEIVIERDELISSEIEKLYKKITRCRNWMKENFKQKES